MAAAAFEDHFANLQSIPTADKQMEFLITLPVPALEAIISSCEECYASLASIALLEKKKSMKFVHIHVFLDDGWKASSTFSGNSDSSDNVYLKELAFTGSPTAAMKSSASSLNSIQDAEIVDFLTKVNTIDFKISVEDADFELQQKFVQFYTNFGSLVPLMKLQLKNIHHKSLEFSRSCIQLLQTGASIKVYLDNVSFVRKEGLQQLASLRNLETLVLQNMLGYKIAYVDVKKEEIFSKF